MLPEHARLLCDYIAWANQRTLESWAPLTGEQFTQNLRLVRQFGSKANPLDLSAFYRPRLAQAAS
jgi:uncharacterized damage-inducible protein DinB